MQERETLTDCFFSVIITYRDGGDSGAKIFLRCIADFGRFDRDFRRSLLNGWRERVGCTACNGGNNLLSSFDAAMHWLSGAVALSQGRTLSRLLVS